MENKKPVSGKTKANRILYLAVAVVICLGAVIAGIAASITHRNATPTPEDTHQTDAPGTDTPGTNAPDTGTSGTPITFTAPVSGSVMKSHDLTLPVYSLTLDEYRTHDGIDISTTLGTAVTAAADGVVTAIEDHPLLGKSVTVTHGGNFVTVYRNLAADLAESIEVGANVARGQTLGAVGESALIECCDEPHLHFEMKLSDVSVNPLDYISEESIATSLSGDNSYED